MNEIFVSNIDPERIAHWKRRYPIHWQEFLRIFDDEAVVKRGDADAKFLRQACERCVRLFITMYDLACPTERDRQKMRRRFRLMLAEHPLIEELWPVFRWRLDEHERWVQSGIEELDEDEIAGEA
jgi:hypothetical protein